MEIYVKLISYTWNSFIRNSTEIELKNKKQNWEFSSVRNTLWEKEKKRIEKEKN